MHALVIYDSNFGNTQKIANVIAKELHTKALSIKQVSQKELADLDLLIVGSPINGWRPSERMNSFLKNFYVGQLQGVDAASFDTRVKLFIHGDAAGKISHALEEVGAKIIASPKGFFVQGTKGPLSDGEIEKAKAWADSLLEKEVTVKQLVGKD